MHRVHPFSLTFRTRRICCHSNETRTSIANSPNSSQPTGTPYHFPKLHPGTWSSVGMRRGTDRHTQRQTAGGDHYTFRLYIPNGKCNNGPYIAYFNTGRRLLSTKYECLIIRARCSVRLTQQDQQSQKKDVMPLCNLSKFNDAHWCVLVYFW